MINRRWKTTQRQIRSNWKYFHLFWLKLSIGFQNFKWNQNLFSIYFCPFPIPMTTNIPAVIRHLRLASFACYTQKICFQRLKVEGKSRLKWSYPKDPYTNIYRLHHLYCHSDGSEMAKRNWYARWTRYNWLLVVLKRKLNHVIINTYNYWA